MKPVFNLFVAIVFCMHNQLYGQTEGVKEYVDKNLCPVKQEEAQFYRIASVDKNSAYNGVVEYFYLSNQSYGRNLYARGEFEKNNATGRWEWWYENGQPKEVGHYVKQTTYDDALSNSNYRIESFWDSTGVQLVSGGSGEVKYYEKGTLLRKGYYLQGLKHGEWQAFFDDGRLYYRETYEQGEFRQGISYNKLGESFSYSELGKLPEMPDGIQGLMRYLTKSLNYPKSARKKGIEGKVFVQFVVEKDGSIVEVEVLKGIGGGCDEEAIRVVRECPTWQPAIQRGQKVRVRMTLPIVYRLT